LSSAFASDAKNAATTIDGVDADLGESGNEQNQRPQGRERN
jgi:hypothetical protein